MQHTTKPPQAEGLRTAPDVLANPDKDSSLEKSDQLKLLEMSISEEHYFIDAHQKRINFFASLISAILAATIAGALRAARSIDFFLLCAGPILISFLSWTAKKACLRFYLRFLEAVTVRGKLEESLGLAKEFTGTTAAYWKNEPLVPERHLQDRIGDGNESSGSFVDKHRERGDPSGPPKIFTAFLVTAVVLLIALGLIGCFYNQLKDK